MSYSCRTIRFQSPQTPDFISFFNQLCALSEREQRIKLEQENALLIPDANMARDIIKYNGLYTLKEVVDLIEKGRTELCTLFRKSKIFLSIQELAI